MSELSNKEILSELFLPEFVFLFLVLEVEVLRSLVALCARSRELVSSLSLRPLLSARRVLDVVAMS
jgi:hypothetical protein